MRDVAPQLAVSNVAYDLGVNAKDAANAIGGCTTLEKSIYHFNIIFREFGISLINASANMSVSVFIPLVFQSSAPVKIANAIVKSIVVFVARLLPGRTWTYERLKNQVVNFALFPVSASVDQIDAEMAGISSFAAERAAIGLQKLSAKCILLGYPLTVMLAAKPTNAVETAYSSSAGDFVESLKPNDGTPFLAHKFLLLAGRPRLIVGGECAFCQA